MKLAEKVCKKSLITGILIFLAIIINGFEVYGDERKQVLFISSYNFNSITFNDHVLGIEEGMNNNVQLHIEYMDFEDFSNEENEDNFYNLLKYKINNYKDFDAVILADDDALRFAIKYKDELFNDIPVVFFAVSNMENLNKAIDEQGMFGVAEVKDIEENLKLALKLNKNAKNIIFLDGSKVNMESKDASKSIDKEMLNKYALQYPDINFKDIYSEDMEYEEFVNLLRSFTKDDIVISIYPHLFKNNIEISHKDFVELISQNVDSDVPVYTIIDYGLEDGLLGGLVTSHFREGKEAGKIATKILSGEPLENLSIRDSAINEYIFNYTKLKELGIKENELPDGSIILNKPESFFKRYKKLILPGVLTIIALCSIILTLIIYLLNQKKYEREILKAKLMAEEINISKNHFISNISHELRTPVAVIASANQLIRLKMKKYNLNEDENTMDKLNIIDKNCYRLMRLINNIIDSAKIEGNFMKLNPKNLNVVEVLEDIVVSVIPYAENKNINIIFDTSEEEVIMALDREKIERVVLNLLSNAIKFSDEGGDILFNVYIENNNLVFYVKDNGIGMEKDDLEKIFEKFIQVGQTVSRKNEGSGIGLSLVKSFVELQNGEISVESIPKQGSKFTVKLPITLVEGNGLFNNQRDIHDDKSKTIINTKLEFSDIYF